MKRFLLLACLFFFVFSCEDAGPDDCYAVDITKEECLARGKCVHLPSFFVFTNDDGCLLGEAWGWFPGRNLLLGVCAQAVEPPDLIDNYNPTRHACRRLTSNLHAVVDTTMMYGARLGEGWEPCYYEYDWMFQSLNQAYYFTGDCRPRCGDDIVDPGEGCEAALPPSFENCTDLGSWLERDYQPGELTCAACTQNIYECVTQ